MDTSRKKVALITGASTGVGLAIGRELMKDPRHHVVLTARSSSLDRFAQENIFEGENVWIRPLDVTDRQQMVDIIYEIEDAFGGVDLLINNAAITYRTVTEYTTPGERRHQMAVNYEGPMALTTLVLTKMRERREGQIVQISSAAGLMPMPTMGTYASSKHALEAASEALHYEVRPFNIRVSLVIAGFINSPAYERSVMGHFSRLALKIPTDCYNPHFTHMNALIERFMKLAVATSESVAHKVVSTSRRKRVPLRVFVTWDARLMWWFRRFIPHPVAIWLTYHLLPNIRKWRGKDTDTSVSGEFRAITSRTKRRLESQRKRQIQEARRNLQPTVKRA